MTPIISPPDLSKRPFALEIERIMAQSPAILFKA
jgi:hypothetical protein